MDDEYWLDSEGGVHTSEKEAQQAEEGLRDARGQ